MKKQVYFMILFAIAVLSSCGGKDTKPGDADSTGKNSTGMPTTSGVGVSDACTQALIDYEVVCNDYLKMADEYYNTGVIDETKQKDLDAKAEKFSQDWTAGDMTKYTPACMQKFAEISQVMSKAGQKFSEAAMKHMSGK